MKKAIVDALFYFMLLASQVIAIIFYGIFHNHVWSETDPLATSVNTSYGRYPYFQDIHIMVFVGIAFLFAFLKRHKLGSITDVFWVAAISVQYYHLWNALFSGAWNGYGHFYTWTYQLIRAEYCAIAMVIALGAMIGKANNLQLFIMLQVGVLLYTLNEQILFSALDVFDIGGSMYVFMFGALYGIGVSWLMNYKRAQNNLNFVSNVTSNTFALIGTLFLWCFFLSFNSALAATPVQTNIAVVNTYFSLIGSMLGVYLITSMLHRGKVHMEHILNATLTGGILMGAGANLLYDSFVAYLVGGGFGIVFALSFTYVSRVLRRLGLIDVAGVFHTFFLPGFTGGWLSAIYRSRYFDRGGIQIAGLFISLGISLVGGLIVGAIIRWFHYYVVEDEYYNDMSKVYFDDVADFHSNPNPYYATQRRLLFGPGAAGQNVVQPMDAQRQMDVEPRFNVADREAAPVL